MASKEVALSDEERAAIAFKAEQEIKTTIKRMRGDWIVLARQVYFFTKEEMWRDLGYTSVSQWMASPDIDFGYRHLYVLIEVYETLVVQLKLPEERLQQIALSRVREVTPAVRLGRVKLKEALNDAESLGRQDLRDKYQGITTVDRPLDATKEPQWSICPACGSRVKRSTSV